MKMIELRFDEIVDEEGYTIVEVLKGDYVAYIRNDS